MWRCRAQQLYQRPKKELIQLGYMNKIPSYGSVIIITFGDGTTEKVFMIRSGYSSLIFEIKSVPMPEPVPPPRECVS